MKLTKRILGLALALMLLMSVALAETILTPSNAAVQKIAPDKENQTFELTLYRSSGSFDKGDVSVYIDGAKQSVTAANTNTSWIFLVDTSTVSTKKGSEPINKTLKTLMDKMASEDNGMICGLNVGQDRTLVSKHELDKMNLNELLGDAPKQSFSDAVVSAINYLRSNKSVKGHSVLVIISNGNPVGTSAEELEQLANVVNQSNVTVYSIAYGNANSDQEIARAYLKLGDSGLGSKPFWKQVNKANGEDTAESVVDEIDGNEVKFKTLTVYAGELASAELLEVSFTTGEKISYPISGMLSAQPPIISVDEEIVVPEPEPWWKENLKLLVIGGGAVLLVIIGVVVLLVVLRRGKSDERDDEIIPPPEPPKEVRVTLTCAENGARFAAITRNGECIVGRSNNADLPLPDPQTKISREHVRLSYENDCLMLEDLGSRNHTYINTVMVNRKTVLQQGDIIRMGDNEYRVSWRMV